MGKEIYSCVQIFHVKCHAITRLEKNLETKAENSEVENFICMDYKLVQFQKFKKQRAAVALRAMHGTVKNKTLLLSL